MRIGVLDLQGAVREHMGALEEAGAEPRSVKRPADLAGLDGIVIPGGESTTIGMLMDEYGLRTPLLEGIPIMGTCAGMILLARELVEGDQPLLGLMDMQVARNAFGRQRESFESEVTVSALGAPPVNAVFIRAPYATRLGPSVQLLAQLDGRIVGARQGPYMALAFHPELTADRRLHRYFIDEVARPR